MTNIFKNILLVTVMASCTRQDSKSNIQFYHRSIGENNHVISYDDFLSISRYSSNRFMAMELYKIAVRYHDSVRARYQIRLVTFMAKDISGPEPYWDSNIWAEDEKYCLIAFGFKYKQDKGDSLELNAITLWKDSYPHLYDAGKDRQFAKKLDSILSSPALLSNH
jgi:hypothetical protein